MPFDTVIAATSTAPSVSHADPIAPVIFGVTVILSFALIGRFTARKLGQPTVLGELIMGLLLGNVLYYTGYDLILVLREGTTALDMARLALEGHGWDAAAEMVMGPVQGPAFLEVLRGVHGGDYVQIAQAVDIFSRYGVIFLLFHVGLDTCVAELRQVGFDSLRVAVLGVLVPFALGFSVAWVIVPDASHAQHIFLGATLGATSIGITARVLQDLNRTHSHEARIILGAAVMDDVLGLIMLAIVSGIVVTGSVEFHEIARTVVLATLFIVSVLMVGPYVLDFIIRMLRHLTVAEAKLFISFIFVMVLAWTANLVGLATIVGAFAAGLLMLESQFRYWGPHHKHKYSIKELFAPLEAILVPIFFVLMGIQVKLEMFLDWQVVMMALGLLAAAILGKLLAGLGAFGRVKRLAVGIGMVPRGEVGLVFASIGKSLGVVDTAMFSAVVLMVIVTTLITPPWLKWSLGQGKPEPEVPGRRKRPGVCE